MITCPLCTLVSPNGAEYCDCGYALTSGPAAAAFEFAASRRLAWTDVGVGSLVLLAGIAVSILGMLHAHPYIAWGGSAAAPS